MMNKSEIDFDEKSGLPVFNIVFKTNFVPGPQMILGSPGEHVFEILTRWLAINAPHIVTAGVKQVSFESWAALDADPQITFDVIV